MPVVTSSWAIFALANGTTKVRGYTVTDVQLATRRTRGKWTAHSLHHSLPVLCPPPSRRLILTIALYFGSLPLFDLLSLPISPIPLPFSPHLTRFQSPLFLPLLYLLSCVRAFSLSLFSTLLKFPLLIPCRLLSLSPHPTLFPMLFVFWSHKRLAKPLQRQLMS